MVGAGKKAEAIQFAGTTEAVLWLNCTLLLLAGIVAALVLHGAKLRFGAAAVFIGSAVFMCREYLNIIYRANDGFQIQANLRIIDCFVMVGSLALVYFFHYAGLAMRFLIPLTIGLVLNYWYRPMRAPIRFSAKHWLLLLKVGIPLFAFQQTIAIANTFPRIVLLSKGRLAFWSWSGGGADLVGLFQPAFSVMVLCQLVPAAIAQYVYPKMSHTYGRTGDPKSLWAMSWKTAALVLLLSVPPVIVGEIALPWLVKTYLPKWAASEAAVRWGVISGAFMGVSISLFALSSLKAWRWMIVYGVFYAAACLVLPALFFHTWSDRLEGVAAGYALAQAISFLVGFYCIYRATHAGSPPPLLPELPSVIGNGEPLDECPLP
jgi:hypothetical protein